MKYILRMATMTVIMAALACAAAYADKKDVNYDESLVPENTLPDVLKMQDGTPVTSTDMWMSERRPEILELFRDQVYGRSPAPPENMSFETIVVDREMYHGLATRKTGRVCFTKRPDGPCMNIHIFIPNDAPRPVPVFVGIMIVKQLAETPDWPMPGYLLSEQLGGMMKYLNTTDKDDIRSKPVGSLPGKKLPGVILKRGYAFATIEPDDLAPDDPETYDTQVISEFSGADRAARQPDDWKAISAWAWGLSRAIDYFEQDDEIDATRVIAIGHSRRGKTALWAAAQDPRFAAAISNNSGCTGAAISRRAFGETVGSINRNFPHWFADNYRQYNENEDALPIDQHMLIALIAPRPVYVASGADDQWADPRGEFLSTVAAGPVYELFGKTGVGVTEMPILNDPVGDTINYHIRVGKHAMTDYDWLQYLDFADRLVK